MFVLNPVPEPPSNPTSKYIPSVNPWPPFKITIEATKFPWVNEDSNIIGDAALENSITVPTVRVNVRGLLIETVVVPAAVTIPVIVVLSAIPGVFAEILCPTNTSEFVANINWVEPILDCSTSLAKYLVSVLFRDCTTGAKLWSPRKNVNELAASELFAKRDEDITPVVISVALIWLVDSDIQLFISDAEVFTTLLTSTVIGGVLLDEIESDSEILILFTIVPYSLLSIKAVPWAVTPAPGGALKVIVGGVVYPLPPINPLNNTNFTVTTWPLTIVAWALAWTKSPPGLPPEIITLGAEVYPEPAFVKLIWYRTPGLYSVACIWPPVIDPEKIFCKVNWSSVLTGNVTNWLLLSLFKIYETVTSCWMAISPAKAPSIASLSASLATVNTLNGLSGGIWSNEIFPESVSSTSALGTALDENGLFMNGPRLFVM